MKRTYQPSKIVRKRRHGFQKAHVDQERALDSSPPARARPQEALGLTAQAESQLGVGASPPIRIDRIKRRADFLRAQKFRRQHAPGLTLETCASPEDAPPSGCRVGFTASRKVGGAVERNRAKRRLRAAAADNPSSFRTEGPRLCSHRQDGDVVPSLCRACGGSDQGPHGRSCRARGKYEQRPERQRGTE